MAQASGGSTEPSIPLFDAQAEFERDQERLEEAALRVLRSGRYILGPEVDALETEVAERLGVPHAVSCASGTDALWLALRALGLGPGDGIIVPAFTFFATASAVLACGATPLFCDIDAETHTIDPEALRDLLEGRSAPHRRLNIDPAHIRAVVPVHLFGRPADMTPILELAHERGLHVVEDAAQAFGARLPDGAAAGAIGDLGCFSFFPTKNLGGFGDGGLVATSDPKLYGHLQLLRAHGSQPRYTHHIAGSNSRLDAIQAALLRVRLAHVERDIERRGAIADAYDEILAGVARTPKRSAPGIHSFNLYVIEIDERSEVIDALTDVGIASAIHYPSPAHLQPAVADLGYLPDDLPAAEAACDRVLTLPMYPSLPLEVVRRIAQTVVQAMDRAS